MEMKVILEMTGGPLRDGETLTVNYPYTDVSPAPGFSGFNGVKKFEPIGIAVVTRTYEGVSSVRTLVLQEN